MLPIAAQTSDKDSFSSIAELSGFSLVPPSEGERPDYQTVDAFVGHSERSVSPTRHHSFYDTKCSSGNNGSNLAQILARSLTVNRCTTRFVFDSTSSPSKIEVDQKSLGHHHSLDQCGHVIRRKGAHSIKNEFMKNQTYYATRQDLLKRLEQGSSQEGLGDELKVMISMMGRTNTLLIGLGRTTIVGAPTINMNVSTINQGTALAAQMKHYFNTLGEKYQRQIDNIAGIKTYLPSLGPHMKSTLIRTALKIWNERIIITINLASPQLHEQDTFTRLATFYATQVFTIFLLKPQYPSNHPLHALAATLLEEIPRSIAYVCATHAALMRETENLAKAMSEARTRLPSALGPAGCIQAYLHERSFQDTIARLERKARKAGMNLDASAREGSERRPHRARGTPGGYPVISLREYIATATARREEGAKAKGKVTTEGEEMATGQSKGKRTMEGRGREEKELRRE